MKFFVGLDDVHHAFHFPRVFISVNRLRNRRSDFIVNDWIMDSGAFSEISRHGTYRLPVDEYVTQIERCPRSGNPAHGSKILISYEPGKDLLEVVALRAYVDAFANATRGEETPGEVRSMEGMIQQIAKDCANCVGVAVEVNAALMIHPNQEMNLKCRSLPARQIIPERKAA